MKTYGVFINSNKINHVIWWNTISRFVKVLDRIDVIETSTGKTAVCIFKITGLFAKRIASKNVTFIENPVEFTI